MIHLASGTAPLVAPRKIVGALLLLLVMIDFAGCQPSKPPPTLSVKPIVPLAVHTPNLPSRVFAPEEEVPSIQAVFQGAPGFVRVTLEFEGAPNQPKSAPTPINDILFRAVGEGTISLSIKRPSPGHPNGRVTISCRSGLEESTAEFEPELWFEKPGAIVTFEAVGGENSLPISEGTEVILGRYAARNLPQDLRLNLKAMFLKKPIPPRTNAGLKPVH